MSRAFVKEEQPELPALAPPRAGLPADTANYVTARGLRLLQRESDALARERSAAEALPEGGERVRAMGLLAQRRAALEERLASAVLVTPQAPCNEVRFGTTAVVRTSSGGVRRYRLVGVDEASPEQGDVAFVSPVARAVLGRRAGDVAIVRTPRGEEELEVLRVECDTESDL